MNMKSVIDYFQEMCGYTTKYSHMPCLRVGSQKKVNYLSKEVCSSFNLLKPVLWILLFQQATHVNLVPGMQDSWEQRYTKGLNEKQITSLLDVSGARDHVNKRQIFHRSSSWILDVTLPHFSLWFLFILGSEFIGNWIDMICPCVINCNCGDSSFLVICVSSLV